MAIPLGEYETIQRPRTHTWKGRTHDLFGEIGDFWGWRLDAACRDYDSELFFAAESERPAARIQRERAAKAVCAECPVRPECASFALAHYEPFGVWGGLSERDREFIWRRERATALAP